MEKARKWMRRRSAFDDGERSDSGDDDLGSDAKLTQATEHVGLVRPPVAIDQQRRSEPLITQYTPARSLSDPAVQLDRHGSELRLLASRAERPVSPHSAQTENPLGLTLVHCPPNPRFDLIFVHGVGGTSVGTWSHERDPRYFWPPWLADDTILSSCRSFTFGYNAAYAAQYSSAGILDFAKDLLFRMKMFSGDSMEDGPSIGTLPIAFVTHSMGGLVVKKAYVIGKSDPQYSQIMIEIRSIVFLATPHKGSQYADMLNNILKALPHSSAKQYVTDIAQNSAALQEINEQFRNICGDLGLISFYETQKTNLGPGVKRMIVDKESSLLGYPGEDSSSLVADHHGMTKFKSRQDSNYINLRNTLRHICKNHLQSPEAPLDSGSTLRSQSIPTTFAEIDSSLELTDRQRLMHVLGIDDTFEDEYEYFHDKMMDGTCQWLLGRRFFRDWAAGSSQTSDYLWLTGSPGAGKSTWAAFAVDWLRQQRHGGTCQHHFFQRSHQHKRTVSYLLRSIAYQVAQAYESFRARILQLSESTGLVFGQQKPALIWEKIFEGILFPTSFDIPLYWVIDGLDESESSNTLLKFVSKIKSSTRISILFLSRQHKDIQQDMDHFLPARIHENITSDDLFEDIRDYVRSSISHTLSESHHEDIIERILHKAAGSFLWVKLALEKIKSDWHTRQGIMRALTEVHEGMESMFEGMITDIAHKSPRLRNMATRILTWSVCSFKPLELRELRVALMPEFEGFVDLGKTVEEVCAQFVVISKGKVTLIHETARVFLLQKTSKLEVQISGPIGHENAADICMSFFSDLTTWKKQFAAIQSIQNHGSATDSLAPFDKHPFLTYALFYWSYHVSHAPVESDDLLERVLSFLESSCLLWMNGIALTRNLRVFIKTTENLKTYLKRRAMAERKRPSVNYIGSRDEQLRQWAVDILRVVGRFGTNLSQDPSCVYKYVIPFCPDESIIHKSFAYPQRSAFSVTGKWPSWNDCLARLSTGDDQMLSKLLCKDRYLIGLSSTFGTLFVWHSETFEELKRIKHKEWVTCIAASSISSLVATAGYRTIRIWNLKTGEELLQLARKPDTKTLALAFGANDSELLIGSDDCSIVCVNAATAVVKWTFTAKEAAIQDYTCPRYMSFSPDLTHVAIVFRGKPVYVWTLRSSAPPRRCVCNEDRNAFRIDAWNAPEMAIWHPVNDHILILYEDTKIIDWSIADEAQVQHNHTSARAMALSPDGNLLITSDVTGTLSIWMLPECRLTYKLESDDLVTDLAFTADGTRFCDIRGSFCNLWESEALVHANEIEEDDMSSAYETLPSEPTISTDYHARDGKQSGARALITALVHGPLDRFYCCGFDDGTVSIYKVADGEKVRNKVMSHEDSASVIKMAWSFSGDYLASADDSSRIIVKRLERPSKQKPKWAVFPVSDFRADDAVEQLLFSCHSDFLLVSCPGTVVVLSLKTKKIICRASIPEVEGSMWLTDPIRPGTITRVNGAYQTNYSWETLDLRQEDVDIGSALQQFSLSPSSIIVEKAFMTGRNLWVMQLWGEVGHKRTIQILDPGVSSSAPTRRTVEGLADQVSCLIGCLPDRLVFLDRHFWVCTWDLESSYSRHRRHFFLPQYLLSPLSLSLIRVTRQGTLLLPHGRDIIIVRSGLHT